MRFVVVVSGDVLGCASMNILIENQETFEYLTEAGQWTKNPHDGRNFPATKAALQVARHEAIGKFNIVCHIPQTDQFINLDHGRGKGPLEVGNEPGAGGGPA
jgi:hypothetical protein